MENYISRFTETELDNSIFITGLNCANASPIVNDLRYSGEKDLFYFAKPGIMTALYENEDRVFDDVLNVMKDKILLSIVEYFFYQMLMYSGRKIHICNFVLGRNYEIMRLS